MKTISDTGFPGGEGAVPHRGAKSARPGRVGDMAEEPKREPDASTRFLPDSPAEEPKAPSAA